MKKLLLAPALLLALAGCSGNPEEATKDVDWDTGRFTEVSDDELFDGWGYLRIVQDNVTGCQYILTYKDVVTPVLKEDGKPYCVKK
ncbi:hypothetical protein Grass_161 [Bacillus phage Grass]|uniref:DUF6440 domain-containing protein n=1 Tax=Bacillus phage Grass TaxID=1406785 RepID=U5PUF0_BPGRA|nr:hypothetical protein Grass_161 [Bacillus phage Grass]AGY47426.1 hypothetical protein Grass_161 [Bacillus phage Grass]